MIYKVKKPFTRKGIAYDVDAELELAERDAVYLWMGGFVRPVFDAKPVEKPRRRSRLEVVAAVTAQPKTRRRPRKSTSGERAKDEVAGGPVTHLAIADGMTSK